MEGILFDVGLSRPAIPVLLGLVLLAIGWSVSSSATWPMRRRAGNMFSGRSLRSPM